MDFPTWGTSPFAVFAMFILVAAIAVLFVPLAIREPLAGKELAEALKEHARVSSATGPAEPGQAVGQFLSQLASLSEGQWRQIADNYMPSRMSMVGLLRLSVARRKGMLALDVAASREPRLSERDAVRGAVHGLTKAGVIPSVRAFGATVEASEAILYRDTLSREVFERLFSPFRGILSV